MRICRLVSLVVLIVIFGPGWLLANHGPGASGGGAATISGEVLKPEHFELELREDYSEFQHFNPAGAIQRAAQGGDFDALDRGFFTSLSGAYGLFPNFQIGAGIGYFVGQHFVSSSQQPDGTTTVGEVNPTGFTDLVVIGKYRVLQGKPGNLSLIA
ncbi:MAG TPA: hypothetical protein VLJ39_21470, partial [Tepidisphaeraceae bacterium]|nr:hypothetical protein [Tepidisphaeraceae bacterium]